MALINKPSVILADDHIGMRKKIEEILGEEVRVMCKVGDGAAAIEAALRYKPDILLLDVAMPKCSGIQAARDLRRRGSACKIIFLTVQEDADYLQAATEMSACYVLKTKMCTDLSLAIKESLEGGRFVSALSAPVSSASLK
jgi:DNA-binding NarL/FixJ family response regulator